MNKEVYVNIKISMPNGSDMSFSDEEIKEIQDYYEKEFSNFDYLVGEINVSFVDEKTKQIDQLKQQLAEKDKELIYMTKQAKKFNNEAQKYYEDAYCNGLQNQNQKAIAELEKVKELVKDKSAWQSPFGLLKMQESDVEQIIDQQIKELKGEKDGTRN